jgi:unsaturated rhamnogalacturonyl hydrolase
MLRKLLLVSVAVCLPFAQNSDLRGQAAAQAQPRPSQSGVGDSVDNPPPPAKLSSALKPKAIDAAMRKVGDWELERARPYFSQDWTFAALYAGFMDAGKTLPDSSYEDAMMQLGAKFDWKLGPRLIHADDQAIGQTYLELYKLHHDAKMIQPTREQFDALMKTPDDPQKPVWWWCDALFMGPPVWARLYSATGDKSYLDYMDHEWWITSNLLYDSQEHLYFRDAGYLHKTEANGRKLFWSRGNGWVMGGLARVLQEMPLDYPSRPKYVEQYRQMAERIAGLQKSDGLWRSGLLDEDAYQLPEVSGSAFFVYSLAWGVNQGILDRATYLPVIQKGWAGLLSHVYSDGRLGSIQPIGAAPGVFQPSSSYVYGVGAFLLAGSELHRLAEGHGAKRK